MDETGSRLRECKCKLPIGRGKLRTPESTSLGPAPLFCDEAMSFYQPRRASQYQCCAEVAVFKDFFVIRERQLNELYLEPWRILKSGSSEVLCTDKFGMVDLKNQNSQVERVTYVSSYMLALFTVAIFANEPFRNSFVIRCPY